MRRETLTIEPTRTYYEVLVHEKGWNLENFNPPDPTWPRPTHILTRGLVYPQRTYLCSLTPSQWVSWLDTQAMFEVGVEVDDLCREWWWDAANEAKDRDSEGGAYFTYSSCCREENGVDMPFIGRAFKDVSNGRAYTWGEDAEYNYKDTEDYDTAASRYEDAAREDTFANPSL